MQAFVKVRGIAVPLAASNIDTDVIMPKQFLKGIDRSGLDRGLFYHLRFDEQGSPRPGFILNQAEWRDAAFLIAGPNFGCGSSREHAVWGLMQYGIRCIIAQSFAGIFFDNCARNGLLAIELGEEEVRRLLDLVSSPADNVLTIDLNNETICGRGLEIDFEIDPIRKDSLLKGLDAVGQTLEFRDEIRTFERNYLRENPWLEQK
ncbi:3-isopropylmalate dehydratase small subunit [Mesorhizobium sp. 1M-11]|uniref:3-isopropylmalate dehydratase small subunit n=1 Tax=Mesorhizobium sp. 1M-11 TaxID=1529006 RepID=UPI0006C77172|nr:3-isopropylmalate dehydratase small subunit [Mesorhizobium sp. 1M-11]